MLKCLRQSLEVDIAYSVNSFIYVLQRLPIFKDLITNDIYSSKNLKKIVGSIGILLSLGRVILLKFAYFFAIFYISYRLFPNTMIKSYFHIYFVLTILGIFINNKHLNTSKKKYFSIILFQMDATKYFHANIFWNQTTNLILNSIWIFFFGSMINSPIMYSITLIVFTFFARLIGEAFNIMFFKKYHYIWYSNTKLYFSILFILLGIASLPYWNLFITLKAMSIITMISIPFGILSLIYLLRIKDYKLMYKKLSQTVDVMNSKNDKDYFKQAMVEVREKDKLIDNKKIQGKKGYDLFNTIFFERHKELLSRSARKYSLVLIGIYIVITYLVCTNTKYYEGVSGLLENHLGYFVIVMYFINRGAIMTQAMFFNCDHAMLRYNFYREPDTLLGLFKKRLITVGKVNLLPAFIIGVGNTVLLILTNHKNILMIGSAFLFILFVSVFFSVHYLVIYYLLQPFNKEMEVKKASYSFATLFTYVLSYQMTKLILNSLTLSLIGLGCTILYVGISLRLVYKYAPRTFKLN